MSECIVNTGYKDLDEFVMIMKAKLDLNSHKDEMDGKSGWECAHDLVLLQALNNEVLELSFALGQGGDDIALESADVANFAMMIAMNSVRRANGNS